MNVAMARITNLTVPPDCSAIILSHQPIHDPPSAFRNEMCYSPRPRARARKECRVMKFAAAAINVATVFATVCSLVLAHGDRLAAQAAAPKNDYADGKNWLCRPDRNDACAVDLST